MASDAPSPVAPATGQTSASEPLLLAMRSITKHFPGVLALADVNFDVRKGEVHAFVGENGAGKSTLMKILSGVYERDDGEILFKGQPLNVKSPRQAQIAGITTIYQELNQVPYLSVTENIFLGSELTRGVADQLATSHARTCTPIAGQASPGYRPARSRSTPWASANSRWWRWRRRCIIAQTSSSWTNPRRR